MPIIRKKVFYKGFTLPELMVTIGIISIVSMSAAPSFVKSRKTAKVEKFIAQLQAIEHSMKLCAILNRGYPPNKYPRVIPAGGVEKHLPRTFKWRNPTPLGGNWNWDSDAKTNWNYFFEYGMSISSVNAPLMDEELFLMVDRRIDDGNLYTGAFRKSSSHWHRYSYAFQMDKDRPWGTMY